MMYNTEDESMNKFQCCCMNLTVMSYRILGVFPTRGQHTLTFNNQKRVRCLKKAEY